MQTRQCNSIRSNSNRKVLCVGLVLGSLLLVATGCAENVKDFRTEGIQQFRSNQYIESMATLRYALSREPNDAECNYYMGLNYRALAARRLNDGDLPAAKRTLDQSIFYFSQAVKTWPNYMAAVQAKTEALESRGKFDAALSEAEKVASNNRGVAEHFVFLGDEYRARADYDSALRAYKTALSTDPNSARAFEGLGKLYFVTGDRQMAADAFARAHELNPAEPEAAEMLAELGQSQGNQASIASPIAPKGPADEPTPTDRPRIYKDQ